MNDPFEFEVLSSKRISNNSVKIYGVIKIEKSCRQKQQKIKICFQKTSKLKQAVLNAFEYEPHFTSIYNFSVEMKEGNTKEIEMSDTLQNYLPKIWNEIDWNKVQSHNQIGNAIINELTEEIRQLTHHDNNNNIQEYKDDDDDDDDDETLQVEMIKQVDLNCYMD